MWKDQYIRWGLCVSVMATFGFLVMPAGAGSMRSKDGGSAGMTRGPMKVTIEGKNVNLGWVTKIGAGQRDGGQRRLHYMKEGGYGAREWEDVSYAKIRITNVAESVSLAAGNTCGEDDGCGEGDGDGGNADDAKMSKLTDKSMMGEMDGSERDSGTGEPAKGQAQNVLRVGRVLDENGKEMTGMEGWLLFYLETDKSRALITGHRGQWITVTGRLFPSERTVDVDSFKPSSVVYRPAVKMTLEGKNINLCRRLKDEGATGSCERFPQTALQITRVVTAEPLRQGEEMEETAQEESRETPQEEARERESGRQKGGGMSAEKVGVPEMTGWVLHYARTAKGMELLKGHQDQMVQVTGTVLPYRRLIVVDSIKPIEGSQEKK